MYTPNPEESTPQFSEEEANAEIVDLSSFTEMERISFTLPAQEAEKLRQAAQGSSVSKKVRESINLKIYLDEHIANGGQVFVRTHEGRLLNIRFTS